MFLFIAGSCWKWRHFTLLIHNVFLHYTCLSRSASSLERYFRQYWFLMDNLSTFLENISRIIGAQSALWRPKKNRPLLSRPAKLSCSMYRARTSDDNSSRMDTENIKVGRMPKRDDMRRDVLYFIVCNVVFYCFFCCWKKLTWVWTRNFLYFHEEIADFVHFYSFQKMASKDMLMNFCTLLRWIHGKKELTKHNS